MDAFAPVKAFESALCAYTGAPYAVAVNSCTAALLLACMWRVRQGFRGPVSIPKRTYVGVAMSAANAGLRLTWRDESWSGSYELMPLNVWDSARWFTSGMYFPYPAGAIVCTSHHISKTLGDSQGGAILHDDPIADQWLRRARFDGRSEGVAPAEDTFVTLGQHCYMSPDVAARLTWRLSRLPSRNAPMPNDEYPDLSLAPAFR